MLNMVKRVLNISDKYKNKIILGIVLNFLKSISMALMLPAIYIVVSHLDSITPQIICYSLSILIVSVLGRFLFQWLMDISMSAKGFDMFRDYRLAIGTMPWQHTNSINLYCIRIGTILYDGNY